MIASFSVIVIMLDILDFIIRKIEGESFYKDLALYILEALVAALCASIIVFIINDTINNMFNPNPLWAVLLAVVAGCVFNIYLFAKGWIVRWSLQR